jgi:hypothetical protein
VESPNPNTCNFAMNVHGEIQPNNKNSHHTWAFWGETIKLNDVVSGIFERRLTHVW